MTAPDSSPQAAKPRPRRYRLAIIAFPAALIGTMALGGFMDVAGVNSLLKFTVGFWLVAILCLPLALILGVVALVKIRRSGGTLSGKPFAVAGTALAGFVLLFWGWSALSQYRREREVQRFNRIVYERDWRTLVAMCREGRSSNPFSALGNIRSREAVPDLIAMLSDPRTKAGAAIALTQIGDERAIPPLIAMLTDKDETVRYHVVVRLWSFPTWEVVKALAGRLRDKAPMGGSCLPSWPLWHNADNALRGIFALEGRERSGGFSAADMDRNVAFWRKFIAEHDGKPILELVLPRSRHENARVRLQAALSLGFHKKPEAVDRLVEMLGDKDKKVAKAVAGSLYRAVGTSFLPRGEPTDFNKVPYSRDAEVWRKWWKANRATFRFD